MSRGQQERQAPWLERARQEARSLAERRALHPQPLDWDTLQQPGGARRRPRGLRPALAWSAPLLAVLLLGGGTVTWAYYVKYVKQALAPALTARPAKPARAPAKKPARARTPRRKRQAKQARPAAAQPKPRKAVRKRRPARRGKASPAATARAPRRPSPAPKQQDVVFGVHEIPGGGELIIVTPPPKLGPLWTPEDFRKRGPSGFADQP
jgi:hypothetical protein